MDDAVIEAIAEEIHSSWMAEKQRQGFADHPWPSDWRIGVKHGETCQFGPGNHHNDMLPYAELPDHVREYGRVTARAAVAGIERAGYRIVRDEKAPPTCQ